MSMLLPLTRWRQKKESIILICNYNKYDDISNYRLDRIRELKILDEPAKGQRLNLTDYMKEHIYMFSSETVLVKFRITKSMISDVIETFGKDITFSDENINSVTVTAHTNEMAMEHFVKVYAPDVIILEPQELADRVKNCFEKIVQNMQKIKEM